jgi:hypothetical protein
VWPNVTCVGQRVWQPLGPLHPNYSYTLCDYCSPTLPDRLVREISILGRRANANQRSKPPTPELSAYILNVIFLIYLQRALCTVLFCRAGPIMWAARLVRVLTVALAVPLLSLPIQSAFAQTLTLNVTPTSVLLGHSIKFSGTESPICEGCEILGYTTWGGQGCGGWWSYLAFDTHEYSGYYESTIWIDPTKYTARQYFAFSYSLHPDSTIISNCASFSVLPAIASGVPIVWRPSSGIWYVRQVDGSSWSQQWGKSGDVSFVGDVDGDGSGDLIVWRPSARMWYVLESSTGYDPSKALRIQWGASGDTPLVGDVDGDGRVDLIVWRPSNGYWYVLKSTTGYSPSQALRIQWGTSGDAPLVGRFDSDARADLIVWRQSTGMWYVLKSTTGYDRSKAFQVQWGTSGDKPLVGDVDGDGLADLIVWRPSNGYWYVLQSYYGYGQSQALRIQWGTFTDKPLVGGYDNDWRVDLAVFRPSSGYWYVLKSSVSYDRASASRFQYGMSGDRPLMTGPSGCLWCTVTPS